MLNRNWFGCATLSQQSWKTCLLESLKIQRVTTSSSTNIPMRATTWSPQVSTLSQALLGLRQKTNSVLYVALNGTSCFLISLSFVFAVFIYSMPGYKCSIRERMLYSSCKNPLVDMVENKLKIEIEKKVRNYLSGLEDCSDQHSNLLLFVRPAHFKLSRKAQTGDRNL